MGNHQSFQVDEFIEIVKKGIHPRIGRSTDAYFDLPENITLEQIIEIMSKISELNIRGEQIYSRLYTPIRLQVYWRLSPRRSPKEHLARVGPIFDPEEMLKFYDKKIDIDTI